MREIAGVPGLEPRLTEPESDQPDEWGPAERLGGLPESVPDLPTFLDRFLFGLAASAVVWLTGGLEAAIVLHAVNNVIVFILAGALGEPVVTDEQMPALAAWTNVAFTALAMGLYVWLVARSRRRLHPETLTPALDLRAVAPVHPSAPWPGPVRAAAPYPPGPFPVGRPASPRDLGAATSADGVGYRLQRRREVPHRP